MKVIYLEMHFPRPFTFKKNDYNNLMRIMKYIQPQLDYPYVHEDVDLGMGWICYFKDRMEIRNEEQQEIADLLRKISRYNNPDGYVTWPGGFGYKPINMEDGKWDDSTFLIEVFSREASKEEMVSEH